jgi:hypothetical protein
MVSIFKKCCLLLLLIFNIFLTVESKDDGTENRPARDTGAPLEDILLRGVSSLDSLAYCKSDCRTSIDYLSFHYIIKLATLCFLVQQYW